MHLVVSLTTIPSKFSEIYHTIDSLLCQSVLPNCIVLHIPRKYSFRLQGEITEKQIVDFETKYLGSSVPIYVNRIENDSGPGTKLLGLFESGLSATLPEDAYILIVDDDLIYKPCMIEYIHRQISHNRNILVGSFDCYSISTFRIGQGANGYLMKWNLMTDFLKYYSLIKDKDYVQYQDDIYISFYFYLKNVFLYYFQLPNNESIYEHTTTTELDGLHNLENKYNRKDVDGFTTATLEEMHREGCFTNLFS